MKKVEKMLRIHQVADQTGMSKSLIYYLIKMEQFPAPVKYEERSMSRWIESEVQGWIEDEIKKSRAAE